MRIISSPFLFDAWKQSVKIIKTEGKHAVDENQPILEVLDLFLEITNPVADPAVIKVDPAMATWMHVNFTEKNPVPELGNAKSYATRLYDYNGKDQLAAVIKKLKGKPETKSATITMLMPGDDSSYVPCVSLLDFKIRGSNLLLTATCRSLDFGKKALYNLVELVAIGKRVQGECRIPGFELHVHAISAHVYEKDLSTLAP